MFPREYRGVAVAVLLFLLVQLGALMLVPSFNQQGLETVNDTSNPTNSVIYIGAVLIATVLFLTAFKYDLDWVVRIVIVGTSGMLSWYVFNVIAPAGLAGVLAAGVTVALWVYPEWYVVDTTGVLMGASAAGLFGITFNLLPAVVLLSVLAVYDAISVYKTEHMLDLADGVMDLRIPVILVIPLTLSYSLLEDVGGDNDGGNADSNDTNAGSTDNDNGNVDNDNTDRGVNEVNSDDNSDPSGSDITPEDEREAFFIGLGDAVIPTVMVASAANPDFSLAPQYTVPIIELNTPALGALVGTLAGLLVLMSMVMKGKPHAGLPLLNGGAIGGYLLGALSVGIPLVEALGLNGFL